MDPTIVKKLRFLPESKSAIVNAPDSFIEDFRRVSDAKDLNASLKGGKDWALIFVRDKSEVDSLGPAAIDEANSNTILWFAYPKKSSGIKTDITRDKGWESIHNRGWAGVSMISIDETWSAFRIRPKENSKAQGTTSDAAVMSATGKDWSEWYHELNEADAKSLSHKEIVEVLKTTYNQDAWWSQMITNNFEKHIGRRKKHQTKAGFEASVSKTLPVPLGNAYQSFYDESLRKEWLDDPGFEISTSTENKSIRALWVDGKTRLSIDFYSKGDGKCQVVVQHLKIPSSEECEAKKAYWKTNFSKLMTTFN